MDALQEFFESELGYVALLFALFVVPRLLVRFRLPTAITSLALGAGCGMGLGLYAHDTTLHLLATFGIVALFLFAGLDVSLGELRREGRVLWQHLGVWALLVSGGSWAAMHGMGLGPRAATILALAVLTPSTGFILDSLGRFGLSPEERFWVKSKAIATEILALLTLFVTMQAASVETLLLSTAVLGAMILLLPVVFRVFATAIAPHAPRSEFPFLLMMALLCAFVTRHLGAYYLVGAFVVGIAARRLEERMPAMAAEPMVHAVELFSGFFVPFYFFSAGTTLHREDFSLDALIWGFVFLLAAVPLRMLAVMLHRRLALRESGTRAVRIALPLVPTLVFTLVLADILRERFDIAPEIFGGLIVYTLLNTLLPGFLLGEALPIGFEPEFIGPVWPGVPVTPGVPRDDDGAKRPENSPAAQ